MPTGCRTLDTTLGGGFPRSSITLIYGEAGSGKSTLALQTVVKAALKGFKTIYIDSDERLSSMRLLQMDESLTDEVLQRIAILRPTSFSEQTHIVESLDRYISRGVALLILDSITKLYRIELSQTKDSFGLNRELNRQMAYLSKMAKVFNIACLSISQARSLEKRGLEPVASRVLKFWSPVVIRMELTGKPNLRRITIEKNEITGKMATTTVLITSKGVEEV
ncbi:MAG: ATPase domain-containing protein [Candidatus Bathyarchaeia archaeon]